MKGVKGITAESRSTMPTRGSGKLNRTVKETVLAVFNELQSDPKVKLSAWAKREPTEFYRIAAKLIPTDVSARVTIVGKDLADEKYTADGDL